MRLDKPGETAMVYRKGELQPYMIDIGWPYQIAVHTPNGHVKNYTEIHQFIRDRGLNHCDLGHTFQYDKSNFYIVYCFAHADHAAIFQARFGGVQYNRKEWRKRQIAERKAAGVPAGKR
jgi:hypothetical protein